MCFYLPVFFSSDHQQKVPLTRVPPPEAALCVGPRYNRTPFKARSHRQIFCIGQHITDSSIRCFPGEGRNNHRADGCLQRLPWDVVACHLDGGWVEEFMLECFAEQATSAFPWTAVDFATFCVSLLSPWYTQSANGGHLIFFPFLFFWNNDDGQSLNRVGFRR